MIHSKHGHRLKVEITKKVIVTYDCGDGEFHSFQDQDIDN